MALTLDSGSIWDEATVLSLNFHWKVTETSREEHPVSAPCCECSSTLFQRVGHLDRPALICISKSKPSRNCCVMSFQTQNNSFLSPFTVHNSIVHFSSFTLMRVPDITPWFFYLTVYCHSPLCLYSCRPPGSYCRVLRIWTPAFVNSTLVCLWFGANPLMSFPDFSR